MVYTGKILNNVYFLDLTFKQTFHSIKYKQLWYSKIEKVKSVLSDEDKFITESNKIPSSFDSTEHNKDAFAEKIGLGELKVQF